MKKLGELGISSAPWSLESYATTDTHYVIDYLDQEVAVFCKGKKSKANARIIAAAPTMYSALWFLCFGETGTDNCRNCKYAGKGVCHNCQLGSARAALAEASGEATEKEGKMASKNDKVYGKYKILDANTGAEKHGKYFVLKIDAKDPTERCAVQLAMAMYADYHKRHGNAEYAKEVNSYVK